MLSKVKNNLMDMKISNLLMNFQEKYLPLAVDLQVQLLELLAHLCSMVAAISFEKYKSDKLKTKMLKIGNESKTYEELIFLC